MSLRAAALACGLLLLAGTACRDVVAPERPPRSAATTFDALVDREWAWRLEQSPLLATSIGDHRYDDRLPDVSLAAEARRTSQTQAFLDALAAIDRNDLLPEQRIDHDMFAAQLRERIEAYRFHEHLLPINADSGFHTSFALLPQSMPFATREDYD